jgi:hypothetical protein
MRHTDDCVGRPVLLDDRAVDTLCKEQFRLSIRSFVRAVEAEVMRVNGIGRQPVTSAPMQDRPQPAAQAAQAVLGTSGAADAHALLHKLTEGIRQAAPEVVGYDKGGVYQRAFCLGWDTLANQLYEIVNPWVAATTPEVLETGQSALACTAVSISAPPA